METTDVRHIKQSFRSENSSSLVLSLLGALLTRLLARGSLSSRFQSFRSSVSQVLTSASIQSDGLKLYQIDDVPISMQVNPFLLAGYRLGLSCKDAILRFPLYIFFFFFHII